MLLEIVLSFIVARGLHSIGSGQIKVQVLQICTYGADGSCRAKQIL